MATLSRLRERDLCTFDNTLLKIAMTHRLSGLRVRTLTINSCDVPPLKHVRARTRPPHLSIKPYLDMTSFGIRLLLFIAMTHAGCGLKLCSVTKNSDDIPPLTCSGTYIPPPQTCSGTYPLPTCQSNPV